MSRCFEDLPEELLQAFVLLAKSRKKNLRCNGATCVASAAGEILCRKCKLRQYVEDMEAELDRRRARRK